MIGKLLILFSFVVKNVKEEGQALAVESSIVYLPSHI